MWDGQGYKQDYTGYYGMDYRLEFTGYCGMDRVINRAIQGIKEWTGIYRVLWRVINRTIQGILGYSEILLLWNSELKRVLWDRNCSCET